MYSILTGVEVGVGVGLRWSYDKKNFDQEIVPYSTLKKNLARGYTRFFRSKIAIRSHAHTNSAKNLTRKQTEKLKNVKRDPRCGIFGRTKKATVINSYS